MRWGGFFVTVVALLCSPGWAHHGNGPGVGTDPGNPFTIDGLCINHHVYCGCPATPPCGKHSSIHPPRITAVFMTEEWGEPMGSTMGIPMFGATPPHDDAPQGRPVPAARAPRKAPSSPGVVFESAPGGDVPRAASSADRSVERSGPAAGGASRIGFTPPPKAAPPPADSSREEQRGPVTVTTQTLW